MRCFCVTRIEHEYKHEHEPVPFGSTRGGRTYNSIGIVLSTLGTSLPQMLPRSIYESFFNLTDTISIMSGFGQCALFTLHQLLFGIGHGSAACYVTHLLGKNVQEILINVVFLPCAQ